MLTFQESAQAFLKLPGLAVAGVSRNGDTAASHIYRKLAATRSEVYPVNPHFFQIDGKDVVPSPALLPAHVHGLVVGTAPHVVHEVVESCRHSPITWIWFHQGIGAGSISGEALSLARDLGLHVLTGGCPLWFAQPVDFFHASLCFLKTRLTTPPAVWHPDR